MPSPALENDSADVTRFFDRAGARLQRLDMRVGLALGSLMLSVALLLAIVLAHTAQRQVLLLGARNLESLSEQITRELVLGMDRFAREIVSQSLAYRFRDSSTPAPVMRAALDRFQGLHPEFSWVGIVDARSGRTLAATQGVFEGGDVRGRPVLEQGRLGVFVGDVHEAVRLAELLPRPANGEALRFLDVAAPIRNEEGEVVRVIAGHLAFEWTSELREQVLGPVASRRGIDMFLVDTRGKVVSSASADVPVGTDLSHLVAAENRPASERKWPDGRRYLTHVALTQAQGLFPGFGWKVLARQPMSVAVAPSASLRNAFLAGALAMGFLAALLAWWISARLVRPVRDLAFAATRAGRGEVMQPALASRQPSEVLQVEQAIRQLADMARVQAEANDASQRRFLALADSLPQVVWQADLTGRIDELNQAWRPELHGTAPETVSDFAGQVVESDRAAFESAWEISRSTHQPLSLRCRLVLPCEPAGRWFEFKAVLVRQKPQGRDRWIGTLFDIHEIVTLAEATQRALAEERAARLESERLARLRDEFLATVSHELRSPLSAITGWSDILARKAGEDRILAQASAVIRRNAQLQAHLIDDLLDMNAVTAGKMVLDLQPVDVAGLTRDVALSHLHDAQLKGVELVCASGAPIVVMGDERRLAQVLSNMVGNSIKFTEAGGRIQVAATASGSLALLSVSDTGRGIAPAFLPHVFDRMRQEDASITRKVGGLGLGLAISRGLVELHGGSIEVTSAGLGQGSTFMVKLSLAAGQAGRSLAAPSAAKRAAAAAEELRNLGGLKVLLVDDEPDARQVAEIALTSLGAEVRAAASAAEVLARLAGPERFDLLLSDIGMPEMDGLQLIRAIRQLPDAAARKLPAVALSAFAMESDRSAGLAAGFQAYVAKPISLSALSQALHEARERALAE